MPDYPGEYIATVLVQRADGTRIYVPINSYAKSGMTTATTFVVREVPKLDRPEVYRRYRTVGVSSGRTTRSKAQKLDDLFDRYGRIEPNKPQPCQIHYRGEEIV